MAARASGLKRRRSAKTTKASKRPMTVKLYHAPQRFERGPLPKTLKSTMVYYSPFALNPGAAGTTAVHLFALNGIYDPDITGVGHQPRGFDQLSALYDHGVVIYAKATLFATNKSGSQSQMVGMCVRDSTTTSTLNIDYIESRMTSAAVLGPLGAGTGTKEITLDCNPNEFLGRSKPLADPYLKNSNTSNPSELAYLHVFAFPHDGATDTDPIQCSIRIEYTVVFVEPINPGAS